MKIAYIIDPGTCLSGRSNGIRSQALAWKNGLEQGGHIVDLISSWEHYDWASYDVVHLFGSSDIWYLAMVKQLGKYTTNLVWSPICDEIASPKVQKIKTALGSKKLHIFSLPYIRKEAYKYFKRIFVRSEYEKNYLREAYHVPVDKICVIPLSLSYTGIYRLEGERKRQCLHISSIYQSRKNVIRLIEAAKKYSFDLILAGNKGSEQDFEPIRRAIDGNPNIKVLGFISEEEKIRLYQESKVFALPSIKEGVGIVALDAAHFGCDIVITKIGGPKEYYNGMAQIVNPYSVDSIGVGVLKALCQTSQPQLKEYVDKNFMEDKTLNRLIKCYVDAIKNKVV